MRLGDENIIAAGECYRHAEFGGERSIQPGFAVFDAVDGDARKGKTVDGVGQDARGLGFGVVTEEGHGIHAKIDATHHAEAARLALDSPGARVKLFGDQVAEVAVRVVDEHRVGPGVEGAGNRCVGFLGHQTAGALVLTVAHARLFGVVDAGNAFNVGRNQELHGGLRGGRGWI